MLSMMLLSGCLFYNRYSIVIDVRENYSNKHQTGNMANNNDNQMFEKHVYLNKVLIQSLFLNIETK